MFEFCWSILYYICPFMYKPRMKDCVLDGDFIFEDNKFHVNKLTIIIPD